MMKFTFTTPDGVVLGLGLTRGNLLHFQQGHPARVNVAEMTDQPVKELFIFYGEDERALYAQFREAGLIGPDTKTIIDPRLQDA